METSPIIEPEVETPPIDPSVASPAVPEASVALTVVSTPTVEVPPSPMFATCAESVSSPATPSSFDLSKDYGVSMIRNNFLTILRESPTQVLERGGDFAGIKAVLEPLLDVMQSLTDARATLPYRTRLTQMEALFNKWQSQSNQPLRRMIDDRAFELARQRDDSQFEFQRQILDKKRVVQKLQETGETLLHENKRVADVEQNQQLLVDSYKAALADIQAKLETAESELKTATERHRAIATQWAEHQAAVQFESGELDKLSAAVSDMQFLSDDDLYRRAAEEIGTAHRETMDALAIEIRRAVERL